MSPRDSSKRSKSDGAPGSSPRSIPSSPAISIAEKARYGFAVGSGHRNSIRFAFGELEYIGMRMQADRRGREQAADVVARELGQAGIPGRVRHQRGAFLPQRLVAVHARAVVAEE